MEGAIPREDLADELARHLEFLRRMARALVRDEQVAEDVVQETLVAALDRRPEPELGLRPWLGSVLRRRVLLHFRTEQRRVAREALLEREARSSPAAGTAGEAERALMSLERSAALGQAVAALEDPYRTVVLLRFYEGLAPKDIALRLQRPVATVFTQLQRGLQQLRQKLDASYGGRREWVSALLPLALDGADGWRPSGLSGVAGVSYGVSIVALASLLAAALGLWFAWPEPERSDGDRGVSLASRPEQSAEDGPGTQPVVEEPAVRPEAATRTALVSPPATPPTATPGLLRLQVSSHVGPVPGARVIAHTIADGESRAYRISSVLRGDEGVHLELTFGAPLVDRHGPPDARRVTGLTDRAGRVELAVLDGAPWTVQVDADGLAPRSLSVASTEPLLEQEVELELGSKLIVDRGSFSLDSNIFATIRSPFDSRVHQALLPTGKQQVEVVGLESGAFAVEGLTTGGVEVALWSTEVLVERLAQTRFDLSLGGTAGLEVEILGATSAAPAHFVAVCGPLNSLGGPTWARYAPVRSGLARFSAVPPGPAVIKVLSRTSEIGREWVDLAPGDDVVRAIVRIPKGELRIRHDPSDKATKRFELARRSQRLGSIEGWFVLGGPLSGPPEAHYAGLADGSYCLWVIEEGAVRRIDLELRGEVVELDLRSIAGELTRVRIERGPGAAPDGAMEIELAPQQWQEVTPLEGVLALSHGIYRTRTASTGIGHITRRIDVPHEQRLTFDGPSSATPVEMASDSVWKAATVIVTPEGALAPPRRSRSLSLYFDRQGRGRIDLLPGPYTLTDRGGRQVAITVEPATESALVRVP